MLDFPGNRSVLVAMFSYADVMLKKIQSLPPEERRELLESLPPEERMAGLSPEQTRQYLDQLMAGRSSPARTPKRKK
jgi:hypothetical protein